MICLQQSYLFVKVTWSYNFYIAASDDVVTSARVLTDCRGAL